MGASSDNTATFGVDLQVSGEGPLDSATQKLEKFQKQLEEDSGALAGMQRALRNLKGGGAVAESQITKLKGAIAAQKATIAQTQAKVIDLGGAFKRTKPPAEELGGVFGALLKRAQSAGGPVGGLAGRISGLHKAFAGGAVVVGVVALAAALVLLVAGAAAATYAISKFALASADAYRSERLQLEGLVKIRNWYGLAADKAGFLQDQINKVSASSALGRDQIAGLAEEFYSLNLRGGNLQQALKGASIALATQGQRGLAQFKAMALGASLYGGSIKKVTEDFEARLGPIARAQLLSIDVQSAKLKESMAAIFRDVHIEGFLKGLNEITQQFSQNTATGRALHSIAIVLLSPLFDSVGKGGPLVKRFFQGMVYGALQLAIGIILVRNWFKRTFADSSILKALSSQQTAFELGGQAVKVFAIALGVAAAAALVLAAAVTLILVPLVWIGKKTASAIDALTQIDWKRPGAAIAAGLAGLAKTVINIASGGLFDAFVSLGENLTRGLVAGFKRGFSAVENTVTQLGALSKGAYSAAIESHSPSKAAARIAFTFPQGAAGGVKAGTPLVVRSVQQMGYQTTQAFHASLAGIKVDGSDGIAPGVSSGFRDLAPPVSVPQARPAQQRATQPAGMSATINVDWHGPGDREQALSFRDQLVDALTQIGVSVGVTLEPT